MMVLPLYMGKRNNIDHLKTKINMYTAKSHYRIMPKVLGGLMEDVLHNGYQKVFGEDNWNEGHNVPVNIMEKDDAYEMHVMAPGLKKEDFKVNVDKNVLHVTYEHKEEVKEEGTETATAGKWLRKEYKVQTFRRSFTLNDKINVMNISAKYNDGVLLVTLPKKEGTQPLTQEITVG